MNEFTEKRREKRLRYSWPVWYGDDFGGILNQGQMLDVSSGGAAFTCYNDNCPGKGQHITARFSVPKYSNDEDFDIDNFICNGQVCRIEEISPFIRKVALQFDQPLPCKPGEEAHQDQMQEVLN